MRFALYPLLFIAFLSGDGSARAFADGGLPGCSSNRSSVKQPTVMQIEDSGGLWIDLQDLQGAKEEQRYLRNELFTILARIELYANEKTQPWNQGLANPPKRIVQVFSGYRSCSYQKNVLRGRGRPGSRHTQGDAADFRIKGVNESMVPNMSLHLRNLARRAGGHGVGLYCGNESHVDLGAVRAWNHCKEKYPLSKYRAEIYGR